MILGIDPGLTGALALYDPGAGTLVVEDVPTHKLKKAGKATTSLDLYGLARIIDAWSVFSPTVWIEWVSASPQMGVTSAFSFGGSFWALQAVAAAHFLPIEKVTPAVWKKALRVPAAKDGARARASTLLPKHSHLWARAKDDGRAEAALIAYYGGHVGNGVRENLL